MGRETIAAAVAVVVQDAGEGRESGRGWWSVAVRG